MPLWETDRNRFHDTLSREISRRNATRTIRGGDFSTPLRYSRNDEGRGRLFFHLGREISPLRSATVEMTEGAGRLFFHLGREISPLRFASVEMTRGALATIIISSGGFMRRLFRGVLFCPLHRGKSRAAGKGEANAVSQSQNAYHAI